MAAARKVSAAHRITVRPSCRRRFASLPIVVVLPAPFTPTMKITRGLLPLADPANTVADPAMSGEVSEKILAIWALISRFSAAASASASRCIFSRTASRISRVVPTPRSAAMRAVSSCFSSDGSMRRSPRKMSSTVADSAVRVLPTDCLSRSSSEGSFFSSLPNSEIMCMRAVRRA